VFGDRGDDDGDGPKASAAGLKIRFPVR